MSPWRSVVALSGGVGGARLIDGLARELPGDALTVVVNTGDDFEHWGLAVSPDLDTVMYTLAGLSHEERGWGVADESFRALELMKRYGGEQWFALGDRDLATHLVRTRALRDGRTLSAVTAQLCAALDVRTRVLPMADEPRRTMIDTDEHGALPFQDWLVRLRAEPSARRVWFRGAAVATAAVLDSLRSADLIVIGPSNPYVSIDPILTLPGVRDAIGEKQVIGVSPIVRGRAVKGPLAAMFGSLGSLEPSAGAVARHYDGLLSGFVVERGDEASVAGVPTLATETVMRSATDRRRLARDLLAFADRGRR